MVINPNAVTLDNARVAALAAAEPATVGHFRDFGFNAGPLFISIPGARFAGRAVTVKLPGDDGSLLHVAAGMAGPGDVLVVDRAGDTERAVLGGLVAWALRARGVEGAIVDGAVTDIAELREYGLAVLYRRLSALTTRLRRAEGEINTPVVCRGVEVRPGDIVLGDENGFVALPPGEAEEVCARAIAAQKAEAEKRERIARGERLADVTRAGALLREALAAGGRSGEGGAA